LASRGTLGCQKSCFREPDSFDAADAWRGRGKGGRLPLQALDLNALTAGRTTAASPEGVPVLCLPTPWPYGLCPRGRRLSEQAERAKEPPRIRSWRRLPCPNIFLNFSNAVVMSGRNPQTPNILLRMDRDGCIRIATGARWLSLDDGLDPAAVRAVLDECYRMLRAEAEGA